MQNGHAFPMKTSRTIVKEGVLVGFECTKSDLYRVWTDDEQEHEGEKTNELVLEKYAIADYVEIKPWRWYMGRWVILLMLSHQKKLPLNGF